MVNYSNYYLIEDILKKYSDKHPLLEGAELSFDDQRSLYLEGKIGIFLYGVITNIVRNEQTLNWNLRVYCVSNLLRDRANEKGVMNTTFEILNDFYNFCVFNKVPFKATSLTFRPLNNFDNNRSNGWSIDIVIEGKSNQCNPFEYGE